jgi:hypothetical protein
MKLVFFVLFFLSTSYADENLKMGTFSLVTEAGWGAAFELRSNGVADIIPSFDSEKEDGSTNPKPEVTHIKGTWKKTKDGIEISYLDQKDLFRFENECHSWEDHPCFRYEKSAKGSATKSLLKYDYPYINWDWKNLKKEKSSSKADLAGCKVVCEKMKRDGTLKKDMTIDDCAKVMCK